MQKLLKNRNQGFTLVELLVTISVIGILSTIVYANFGSARAAARDDVRKADLKEMQLAVELYKAQTGQYPQGCKSLASTPNHEAWGGNESGTYACPSNTSFIVGLSPDYIGRLPSDPSFKSATDPNYLYRTNTERTEYKIISRAVEAQLIESYEDEFARCPVEADAGDPDDGDGNTSCDADGPRPDEYAVYSYGAKGW